jgi:hypothetical protein
MLGCDTDTANDSGNGSMTVDAGPDGGVVLDTGSISDAGTPRDAGPVKGAILFQPDQLVEVNIELAADDWTLIRGEGRGLTQTLSGCQRQFDYTYVNARVTVDGQAYEDVALRKKGFMGSLSTVRPSLKLNFGRLVEGRTIDGMKRMTLNNNKQDPSHTHQCMTYALFASAGLMAPRCNFARVVVNGEDLGIYTHVESVKKPMIARYFEDDSGNLYEGQGTDFIPEHREFIELKTNEMENDRRDFDKLSAALMAPDDELLERLAQVIDLDAFFSFWAMEVLTGHWDSYSGGRNNYLAYHDPSSERFYFIPWGTDGAFSMQRPFTPGNTAATVLAQGLITNRLYTHPRGRILYFERLRALFEQVWDEDALLAQADEIQRLTDAPQDAIDRQKSFITSHSDAIESELEMAPVEWVDGPSAGFIMCREERVTLTEGTFSTTWMGPSTPEAESSVDITLNMEPWMPAEFSVSSSVDQENSQMAQIRYLSPQPDGTFLVLLLSLPLSQFVVGAHPMHGFETNGVVVRFNPRELSGFVLIGVIGDGSIVLDAASMDVGGRVAGSFSGQFLQIEPL